MNSVPEAAQTEDNQEDEATSESDIEAIEDGDDVVYDRGDSLRASQRNTLDSHHEDTTNDSEPEIASLKSRLAAASIDNVAGSPFIPIDRLDELLTEENVKRELLQTVPEISAPAMKLILDEVCFRTKPNPVGVKGSAVISQGPMKKIFAVLVLLGRSADINKFISADVRDRDLPFSADQLKGGNRDVESHKATGEGKKKSLPDLSRWPSDALEEFLNLQWKLMSPYFSGGSRALSTTYHYQLPDNAVLPFVLDDPETSDSKISGGFGEVRKVNIHPSHHSWKDPGVQSVCESTCAPHLSSWVFGINY